jgi:hypothetical protein
MGCREVYAKSARDLIKACFEEREDLSEAIFLNGSEWATPSKESLDDSKQESLWKHSVRLVGLKVDDTALKYW